MRNKIYFNVLDEVFSLIYFDKMASVTKIRLTVNDNFKYKNTQQQVWCQCGSTYATEMAVA